VYCLERIYSNIEGVFAQKIISIVLSQFGHMLENALRELFKVAFLGSEVIFSGVLKVYAWILAIRQWLCYLLTVTSTAC
jgi:hypothetical protein